LEITIPEAETLLRDSDACLLDVREDWEYRRGHVSGALRIPIQQLPLRVRELPNGKRTLVICEHGERSLVAAQYLRSRGFSNAVSISGGTSAWAGSGRPLER